MFVYKFLMSKEASVELCGMCMLLILSIKSVVFFMYLSLLMLMYFLIVVSMCLANLCAGAFVEFIMGLMGLFSLCIFIWAWRFGGLETIPKNSK